MKTSYLLLGLVLIGTGARAQIVQPPTVQRDYSQQGASEYANIVDLVKGSNLLMHKTTAVGSPFADDRWLMANVTLTTKLPLAPIQLKYDVLEHRLLMHQPAPSRDSIELDDHQVASFVLTEPASNNGTSRQRLFRRFEEGPAAHQRDYVEVLHEGHYTLLKHYQKIIKRESFGGMYSTGIPTDEIEDASLYYLRTPEGTLTPVKLNLKSLQSAAPALGTSLKMAASAQKPRTEDDWASVLKASDPAK
jgi:hypothetical protein